jgi:hypothetical protein
VNNCFLVHSISRQKTHTVLLSKNKDNLQIPRKYAYDSNQIPGCGLQPGIGQWSVWLRLVLVKSMYHRDHKFRRHISKLFPRRLMDTKSTLSVAVSFILNNCTDLSNSLRFSGAYTTSQFVQNIKYFATTNAWENCSAALDQSSSFAASSIVPLLLDIR